jgi:hypothetical protein
MTDLACAIACSTSTQYQETVLETLADLFLLHGPPDYIRSDNGAEFTATAVPEWLHRIEVQTLFNAGDQPDCHACICYATISTDSHFTAGLVLPGMSPMPGSA